MKTMHKVLMSVGAAAGALTLSNLAMSNRQSPSSEELTKMQTKENAVNAAVAFRVKMANMAYNSEDLQLYARARLDTADGRKAIRKFIENQKQEIERVSDILGVWEDALGKYEASQDNQH